METAGPRIDLGSAVGPYVVVRKLSQSGPSALFAAHDPAHDREVALRVLPEEAAAPAAWSRLLREARALAAVEHPGVVRVYGAGEQGGYPWIALELVRGTDLRRLLAERGAVPLPRALRWTAQMAEALAAAHEAGVVHRDLRPSNVIVTHDDQIKLVDFGIARRRAEGGAETTAGRRDAVAAVAYMAPELFEHGMADERSDVWSLGCLLFELCTGIPAFARGSAAGTAAAIVRDEPELPAQPPPALRPLLAACLKRSPFQRLASARELASAVRDLLAALGDGAPSHRPSDRLSERPPRRSSSPRVAADSPSRPSAVPGEPPALSSQGRAAARIASSIPASSAPSLSARPPPRERLSSPARTPQRGRIKGSAIRPALAWFSSMYGGDALRRVLEGASPGVRAMVRGTDVTFGIVPSGWYDSGAVSELLELLESVAAPADRDAFLQQLTTAIARDNVGGIYRALFRLITTPSLLEQNAQRVFATYFDEGVLSATVPRAGEMVLALRGQTRHYDRLCAATCAAVQNVLRLAGYTSLVLERTLCQSEGHPHCVFEGFYLP